MLFWGDIQWWEYEQGSTFIAEHPAFESVAELPGRGSEGNGAGLAEGASAKVPGGIVAVARCYPPFLSFFGEMLHDFLGIFFGMVSLVWWFFSLVGCLSGC